jgi:hypothetical protein
MNKELETRTRATSNEPKKSAFSIQGMACLQGSKSFQKED